jgi:hypothetical protein
MDTVIEFIGLFVFTTLTTGVTMTQRVSLQASSNISHSAIVAVAPRVLGDPRRQIAAPASGAQKPGARAVLTSSSHDGSFVEEHTAMIVYREQDKISVTGWTAQKLKPTEDWNYVVLSGEQITFAADARNDDIRADSLQTLPLIHLRNTLAPAYTASGGYTKAAGVFTMPKGTLSTCPHDGNGMPPRIDTRLTLHTLQQLTISGPGIKKITLKAGAPVFIGNIPLTFATSGVVTPSAHEHYKVYCEMVGAPACTWPLTVLGPEQRNTFTDCGDGPFRMKASTRPPFARSSDANDYACSNTQWP